MIAPLRLLHEPSLVHAALCSGATTAVGLTGYGGWRLAPVLGGALVVGAVPATQPPGAGGRPAGSAGTLSGMELVHAVVGPVATNVYVLGDPATREAIAIDTAIPSLAFVQRALADRDWTLKLIVSTHGHWDHIGENAAVQEHTGAPIAVHPLDRYRLEDPQPLWAPFPSRRPCQRWSSRRAGRSGSAR